MRKPARLVRKPATRKSALPQRPVRFAKKNIKTRRQHSPGSTHSGASTARAVLSWIVSVMVLGAIGVVITYLVLQLVVLPRKFIRAQQNQLIAFVSAHSYQADATKILLLRHDPESSEPSLEAISEVPIAISQISSRNLSRNVGILVDSVVQIPVATGDLESGKRLATVLPETNLWERLFVKTNSPEFHREQLKLVAKQHNDELTNTTVEEFTTRSIPPRFSPTQSAECPIAISNTTRTSGLAEEASRMLERSGLLVVRTVSGRQEKQQTTLSVAAHIKTDCQYLVEKIAQALEAQVQVNEDATAIEQYRADMLLELGTDWTTE